MCVERTERTERTTRQRSVETELLAEHQRAYKKYSTHVYYLEHVSEENTTTADEMKTTTKKRGTCRDDIVTVA